MVVASAGGGPWIFLLVHVALFSEEAKHIAIAKEVTLRGTHRQRWLTGRDDPVRRLRSRPATESTTTADGHAPVAVGGVATRQRREAIVVTFEIGKGTKVRTT